jgi:O-acetyl-ADP-ribose deacetylase (regulator of RNase III)
MNIIYVRGDTTKPQGNGLKVIVHVCNDIGAWGAGFVMALSRKWKEPEQAYHAMGRTHSGAPDYKPIGYKLGDVQLVAVEHDIIIANMIGQHGCGLDEQGNPPVRYDAIEKALKKVNDECQKHNASIHMPRIGCGLAGGDWEKIEAIIEKVCTVPVTVYDL